METFVDRLRNKSNNLADRDNFIELQCYTVK